MSDSTIHFNKNDLCELLLLAIDGSISQEDFEKLQHQIISNPQAQDYYYEFLTTYIGFTSYGNSALLSLRYGSNTADDYLGLLNDLADEENKAPAIQIPVEEPERELVQNVIYQKNTSKVNKLSIYTLVLSTAALIFFIAYINFIPPSGGVEVATLTDSVDVEWADSALTIQNNDRILTNRTYFLSKGIVEIHTDRGVAFTVESPAEFEMLPNADMQLNFGRLYAHVSPQGIGFTVNTPNSKIIDLGTEFGIQTDIEGEIELHVLEGKTTLVTGSSWLDKISQTVFQKQARRVSSDGSRVEDIPVQKEMFARSISSDTKSIWRGQKSVSLADIVGGGNGFGSGNRGSYIDPSDGQLHIIYGDKKEGGQNLETRYKPSINPYIDGLFVPNGQTGPNEVSSSGHLFKEVPGTTGRYWYGVISWSDKTWERSIVLDEILYGVPEQPLLLMHSNIGITFDVDAIRQVLPPDHPITEFISVYGISDAYGRKDIQPYADFWVLVDGDIRFSKQNVTIDQVDTIRIPLSEDDRFLTLVATEGIENMLIDDKGEIFNDWCVWGNPVLKIE